jgi:hypothetical protein
MNLLYPLGEGASAGHDAEAASPALGRSALLTGLCGGSGKPRDEPGEKCGLAGTGGITVV